LTLTSLVVLPLRPPSPSSHFHSSQSRASSHENIITAPKYVNQREVDVLSNSLSPLYTSKPHRLSSSTILAITRFISSSIVYTPLPKSVRSVVVLPNSYLSDSGVFVNRTVRRAITV